MCSCLPKGASSPKARRGRLPKMRAWWRPIWVTARPAACAGLPMADPILAITSLHAGYGATEILRGIDLAVAPGEIVAVLGSNGAGKSTLNRAISGVLRPWRGAIRFAGERIERAKPSAIVSHGLIHVPEGRRIFPNMSVAENLDLGCYRRARARRAENRERVFA